jgi:hypothetical protein
MASTQALWNLALVSMSMYMIAYNRSLAEQGGVSLLVARSHGVGRRMSSITIDYIVYAESLAEIPLSWWSAKAAESTRVLESREPGATSR